MLGDRRLRDPRFVADLTNAVLAVFQEVKNLKSLRDREHLTELGMAFEEFVESVIAYIRRQEYVRSLPLLQEATRVLRPGGRIVALILNTRSEYVQSNLQREGSYFQQMVHRDSEAMADRVLDTIDGAQEYFLGIADETLVESSDSATVEVTAVVGTPIGDSK